MTKGAVGPWHTVHVFCDGKPSDPHKRYVAAPFGLFTIDVPGGKHRRIWMWLDRWELDGASGRTRRASTAVESGGAPRWSEPPAILGGDTGSTTLRCDGCRHREKVGGADLLDLYAALDTVVALKFPQLMPQFDRLFPGADVDRIRAAGIPDDRIEMRELSRRVRLSKSAPDRPTA